MRPPRVGVRILMRPNLHVTCNTVTVAIDTAATAAKSLAVNHERMGLISIVAFCDFPTLTAMHATFV